jgi:hypothetical protein
LFLLTNEIGAVIYYTTVAYGAGGWRLYDPNNRPIMPSVLTTYYAFTYHAPQKSIVTSARFNPSSGGCQTPYTIPLPNSYKADPRTGKLRVRISCGTAGVQMRHTYTGGTPSPTVGTWVNGATGYVDLPIGSWILKAIAYKSGLANSAVMQAQYTVVSAGGKVATPDFKDKVGNPISTALPGSAYPYSVTVTCATAGALMRFTLNGQDPRYGSAIYSGSVVQVRSGQTLRAYAYKVGWTNSDVRTAVFTTKPPPSMPTFTPPPGAHITYPLDVTIASYTTTAQLRYTTNGSMPSRTSGTLIAANSGVVSLPAPPAGGSITLKAIAFTSDDVSQVASGVYTQILQVAMPTFTPAAANFNAATFPLGIVVDCATAGATIMTTIDGTTPTADHGEQIVAGQSIAMDADVPLKAFAFKAGMADSVVNTGIWSTLPLCETPVLTPSGGAFDTAPQDVTFDCATAGSSISYTLDGTTPTPTNGTVVAPATVVSLDFTNGGLLNSMTVKAMAFASGYSDSLVTEAFFELNQ